MSDTDCRQQRSGKGNIFVVSAPSGAGKTTICQALMKRCPGLYYSVSHTTRNPRSGEVHGRDYFFVSEPVFIEKIENGRMVEWAVVHGNYYGTSTEFIEQCICEGKDLLLDIDVQGTLQLQNRYPQVVSIFIQPPSMTELERRLIHRGTDEKETIDKRLGQARTEMKQSHLYQHIIVNDQLDQAIEEMVHLVEKYRS